MGFQVYFLLAVLLYSSSHLLSPIYFLKIAVLPVFFFCLYLVLILGIGKMEGGCLLGFVPALDLVKMAVAAAERGVRIRRLRAMVG